MSLDAVEFRCPKCDGTVWQTESAIGHCSGKGCGFMWARRQDFQFFFRLDGRGFTSRLELEAELAGPALPRWRGAVGPAPVPTFPETLHELLAELMAQPPTVGVVQRWTKTEQRLALAWASREVLGELIGAPRMPRPEFIEERAATA